jgi:hypothetical protein
MCGTTVEARKGTWSKLFAAVAGGHLLAIGSIVRVHQHGQQKKRQQDGAMPKGHK